MSKVVHVRNCSSDMNDDLVNFATQFGVVTAVCHMGKLNQALVEMESVSSASQLIMHARANPVILRGVQLYFSFSKSQQINQQPKHSSSSSSSPYSPKAAPNGAATAGPSSAVAPHRILLFNILNPLYAINVDVMYAITSPYGNVLRIVVFNKKGVQALVEFDTVESAQAAKEALDGKDIYTGSCTLRIEYSHAEKLNVQANTDKTRDYVTPLPVRQSPAPYSNPNQLEGGHGGPARDHYNAMQQQMANPYSMVPNMDPNAGMDQYYGGNQGAVATAEAHPVLMVYNIHEKAFTHDKLFNLFCVYGNVIKIKCLLEKMTAMVQMQDSAMAEAAMSHLNNLPLFGEQLQVTLSRHPFILDSRPDKESNSPSRDFSSSPLNRFKSGAVRRVYRPSATLYFANLAKAHATEQTVQEVLNAAGAQQPLSIKFLNLTYRDGTSAPQEETTRNGHIEFTDAAAATEALILANNVKVGGLTFRLAFSQTKSGLPKNNNQQPQAQQAAGTTATPAN